MEDRNHGLDKAEQRHIQPTCASTVAFESCRYIKLEKRMQIRISLDKLVYSFLEVHVKLQHL